MNSLGVKSELIIVTVDDRYVDYAVSRTFAVSNKIFGPVVIC